MIGSPCSTGTLLAIEPDFFSRTRQIATPFLFLDPRQCVHNLAALRQALPDVEVYYALKANPHRRVVHQFRDLEVGFEIASERELRQLLQAGVSSRRILCLHPVKSPPFLQRLHEATVDVLAADCQEEVDKIAEYAPRSRIVFRIDVSNDGSRVPLTGKFGCPPNQALELFRHSLWRNLHPTGITLHVGSQCESAATWAEAMTTAAQVCHAVRDRGFEIGLISLGGGFPAPYLGTAFGAEDASRILTAHLDSLRMANCRITIEPGRGLIASAGTLVATVVGLAERRTGCWAYLDAGVFQGLFEAVPANGGFRYPIEVAHNQRPVARYHLAGPTCDGTDILCRDVSLPELRIGDRIAFRCAGAYSVATASAFNGFPPPTVTIRSLSRVPS